MMTRNAFMAAQIALLTLLSALPAMAQKGEPTPQIATLKVSGQGRVEAEPDMAILNLSVIREAKSAREALSANNEAMSKVLSQMKETGIEARDLQTSNFNISPRYRRYPKSNSIPPEGPEIIGYVVTNSLTVRVRDMAKVGAVLDRSVTLGVNSGGNIQFANSDAETLRSKARERAVKNALQKARTITMAAGTSIKRILSISEQGGRQRPIAMQETMARSAQAAVPIAGGEQTYLISVQMSFELTE